VLPQKIENNETRAIAEGFRRFRERQNCSYNKPKEEETSALSSDFFMSCAQAKGLSMVITSYVIRITKDG